MDVRLGDRDGIILYTPGHSNDSICIYCEEEQVLFSGDSPIFIKSPGGSYSSYFVDALRRLARLKIKTIYSGHDNPIIENAEDVIRYSLKNVLASKIVEGTV
jgi:glyoxylase-like metal-dependent hydrolase (beta-lactamase superfamily II)